MSEIRIRRDGHAGRITLTRPDALHALTLSMCEQMIEAMLAWEDDPGVGVVMIDHEGGRGFCAGGDIRALIDSLAGDGAYARQFFFTEYRLDHLIFTYAKPVITFMDGVVMGGGAGIALASAQRVATENTVFAMPECGIGLFPDVGAGWSLSRLPGKTGLWLALTGSRLKAQACGQLGLSNAHVAAADVEAAKAAIAAKPQAAETILKAPPGETSELVDRCNRLFGGASVEEIVERLERDATEWASAQAAAIKSKCPMMLKVAFRQLAEAAGMTDFADELSMEYGLAIRAIHRADFTEGVRAVIIDKDQAPRWDPPTLEGVSEPMVDEMFAPLPPGQQWLPLPR